jgi:hypothetical protein
MKKLHEFISPLGEFKRSYAVEEANAKEAARLAKLNYRNAKREYQYISSGVSDNPKIAALQEKLHNESYVRRGAGIGAGIGAGGGVAAMAHRGVPGMILGGGMGAILGAFGGTEVGGRIRKNKDKNLSANLKPALRELAARSEQLKEFAMVRDASGRYVEVEEDGGMGAGAAIKAGAGAAALGGAGYGAYKGHQAIMGKYGTRGLIENIDPRLPAAYAKTSAAGTAAASPMQAYRSAASDLGNTISSRASQGLAAGKTAYNAAGRRVGAALPVEGSGFGAKLLRGIRKGFGTALKLR